MKKISHLLMGFALLAMLSTACQSPNSEAEASQTETSAEAPTEETKAGPAAVLNANLATEADLLGIGLASEKVAQILEQRPFLTMNDLDALLGEEGDQAELYQKVFVPFNLNTTPEADFKMIPGVGDRMAHEFEEYRPYTSIQQFRREIGKYVDETEVARLENYVFVPVELNSATEADIKALPGVGDRMAHEFEEYRPYTSLAQFRKEIGKYVDDKELARLERLVYLKD
jgi:DNA uptake protein ComE-like DNA-binding protein